jgi:N-acetylneuraminic acid mutarotase
MPAGSQRGGSAVGVIGGRIYVAGGLRNLNALASCSVYDPAADTWTGLPSMTFTRDHGVGAAVGGLLYVIGGRDGSTLRAQNEAFDPVSATWASRAAMPTARGGCIGGVVGGRIVVCGGEGNPAGGSGGVFSQTEAYDPVTNTWSSLEAMRLPRHGTGAAGIGDSLYVPGGATVANFAAVDGHDALRV